MTESSCMTCGSLSDVEFVDRRANPGLADVSRGFLVVIGGWPTGLVTDGTPVECPACGAAFTMTYSCEHGDDHITLSRMK